MNKRKLFEYVGNVHIHSLYSDGGESVADIAQAASENGLDFIVLNDHEYMMDSLHPEEESLRSNLTQVFCCELCMTVFFNR